MRKLEDKIEEINNRILSDLSGYTIDLKGLVDPVFINDEKTNVLVGTEVQVSLNSDSDITGYHLQNGVINFDKVQNRGKKKMYFPVAPMSLLCMVKDRHLEELVFNSLKDISDIRVTTSDNDKFAIYRDESFGKSNGYGTNSNASKAVNFDYHLFRINYEFNFSTTECKPYCR
jgi:hypothetical protein